MRPDDCRIQLDGRPGDPWNTPTARPLAVLRWMGPGSPAELMDGRRVIRQWNDPLAALAFMDANRRHDGQAGRWIGHLSYDLGRLFEVLPSRAVDDLHWPWFCFGFCPKNGPADDHPADAPPHSPAVESAPAPRSTFTHDQYLAACGRVLEYIAAGDIFQVNLSQRFTFRRPDAESPWNIYRRLRRQTPASYGGCLQFGPRALICNSPELFLRIEADGRIVTRPIKGTRPVGPGMAEALRDSIKDQAELNMIVDLERNDLGRICRIGSVKVTAPRQIETHPTVHHGVATVEGRLRDGIGLVEILAATFPGGSITGAPKIRAMEIIDELEPCRRGPYCGAIGYLDSDGSAQFNIVIRTMLDTGGHIHIPVGGGIVADSQPQAEYEETLVKARALFRALGISQAPDIQPSPPCSVD